MDSRASRSLGYLWVFGVHALLHVVMRSLDFFCRYILVMIWLLILSALGVLAIPFLFGNLNFNHYWVRSGTWVMSKILRIRVKLEGVDQIEPFQPCIYVGNHQDNLDMFIFGSIFPERTIVIGKRELAWIPLFNIFYYAAGNIFLDRKRHRNAIAGLEAAGRKIRERGVSVLIFPEGTRNRSGRGLLPFKKGAFHMAIEAGLPIVPLVASPISEVVHYEKKRITPGVIKVRVLSPIPTKGLNRHDVEMLMKECRERMLRVVEEQSGISAGEASSSPGAS
ncbi:MAG: 1-acyl-sn-glycerol-3-phosphate acyltransferase [Bdellovibrionales bacterium]|nr:1-acyl-sn-glycerol-3-phosphate acyltransferase [Bdellovibrionales bacterium]